MPEMYDYDRYIHAIGRVKKSHDAIQLVPSTLEDNLNS